MELGNLRLKFAKVLREFLLIALRLERNYPLDGDDHRLPTDVKQEQPRAVCTRQRARCLSERRDSIAPKNPSGEG
jgi:hypothetical protein